MSPRDPPNSREELKSQSSSGELQATESMCHHCFDVLLHELEKKRSSWASLTRTVSQSLSKPDFVYALPHDAVECPLFVTWDKRKQTRHTEDRYELRGCIGSLSPKPLVSSVGEYALLSALRDKRFDPVSLTEFPRLRVAVSLLVNYEDCEHCYDWHVGTHGIMIRWTDDVRGTEYSATYLPEVASEQGWDQVKTLSSLIRKAGYLGRVTDTLLRRIHCTRYQSSKHRVSYEEYIQRLGHDPLLSILQGDDSSGERNKGKSPTNCTVQ